MPKGYWIARVDITDPDLFRDYQRLNSPAFAKYGGRFLVRGGPFDTVVGSSRERNIVIEFESLAAARACLESPEYEAAAVPRDKAAVIDLIVISGYDGPQPGD